MKRILALIVPVLIGGVIAGTIENACGWEELMLLWERGDVGGYRNPGLHWEGLGPNGATAEVITYHPSVDGLVYLGTFEEGLFYSFGDDISWNTIYTDNAPINFVLIDPFEPSTILVGAQTWFSNQGYLRRSTDWGQTWSDYFAGGNLVGGAFDPYRPGVSYISIMGDDDYTAAEFYRSTDSGESWTLMNPGGTHKDELFVWAFLDLLVNPEDGSILAFTLWTAGMGQMENHVCLSTDGGSTWEYMDTGLYDSHAYDMEWILPKIVVGGTEDGLYAHRHGSTRWFKVPNEMAQAKCFELEPGPAGNIWYLVEDRSETEDDPDLIHRSTNWGLSWSPLSLVDDPCEIITVAADPHDSPDSEAILAGTWESGVFASSDLGETWETRNEGLPPVPCNSLGFGPPGSGLLYAGAWSFFQAGLYRSRDLGVTWERTNDGFPAGIVGPICPHPTEEHIVYAASMSKGIFKSTDQGGSWTQLKDGLPEHGTTFSLLINPADPEIIFAGTEHGLFRSTNGGDSWTYSSDGMVKSDVRDVGLDPLDPDHMFAAVYVDGIYESLDGGDTWNRVLDETRWKDFSSIAVAPGGDRVYAGMILTEQLFRTTNGGDDWEVVLNNVAETIIVPEEYPLAVACGGSQTNVWISTNGGDDWFTFPGGLEGVDIKDLALPPTAEELLFAATSAGIFHLTMDSPGGM
ncbi:MAG: WD40/YVTN/BNR-like repeat-containing protein [Candidatus Glassbacteria bacterium]